MMNEPKIRFSGYTEAWEQRKLSEVAEIVGGGTPSTNIPEYWDGDIDWYAPAEINDQIYVDGSERKITKLGLEKSSAKILPADKTVLFTSRAGIGKTAILRRSGATNQGFQSMVLNDETNPYFVFSMSKFIKEEAERVASGSTFAEVSGKMLGNLAFMFPTKKEQDKIGEYFSNLDNLITLHQRKCDQTKKLKKYMLQKMFPQNGELYPEIRFEGFTKAWEQRKLSELLEVTSEKNTKGQFTQDDILACSLGTELDKKTIFFGLRSTEESVKSYRVVNIGDVIYTKSPIKGYPNGIVRTCKNTDGIVPSLYCVYREKDNISIPIDTRFIQSYLEDKTRLDGYLSPLVNVGARNNVNITDKGFLEGTIMLPKTKEEQIRIVDTLTTISDLITLHQRKCDDLKEIKKYMLQNMFAV